MKKKRKLLLQIGLAVSVVFILLILVVDKYVVTKSSDIYLNSKNEVIEKDMNFVNDVTRKFVCSSMAFYWVTHRDQKIQSLGPDDNKAASKMLDENNYRITDEYFESLSEEDRKTLSDFSKDYVMYYLGLNASERGYSDIYWLIPLDGENAYVISDDSYRNMFDEFFVKDSSATESDADKEKASSTDSYVKVRYNTGEVIPFDFNKIDGFLEAIEKKEDMSFFEKQYGDNDKAYYIGYRPLYDYENDFTSILCVEYDWTDVYSDVMKASTRNLMRNMLIGLAFSACLLLIMVNLVAIKPLKQVKETLDLYMVTKNSDDVISNLSTVKSKNEIGVLSDNVQKLVLEIDRYNEENVALATKKAKVKTALDLAASIQSNSLITDFPKSDSFEVFASMTPAKEVGGDFYDIFDIDEDHVGFVIADVSGKGLPAALFMMSAMTSIRNFSTSGEKPSTILAKANGEMCKRRIMDMFVTVWLGILDKKTGILTTSNAGHEYPAINVNGKYELYKDTHGLVAGGMPGVKYKDHEIELKKGDYVFVYTDGVPEATDADVKMYGTERMLEALNTNPTASPQEVLVNVKKSVDTFVGEAEQFDDLTMLCIKYNG